MRCAVLGDPIAHSLSPVLHRAGYAAIGLDWTYDAVRVGEDDLAPFLAFGAPAAVQVGRMPYPAMNAILDGGFPNGALNYWLSAFTDGLSDGLIETAVERFASVPSPMTSILFAKPF